jgi:putative DNA primase/helicase
MRKIPLKAKQPSLSFYITDNSGFRWGEEVSMTADELLAPGETRNREANQLEAAMQFLTEALPMASEKLFEEGKKKGISRSTLFRAKEAMGIKARKVGISGGWLWVLPEGDAS